MTKAKHYLRCLLVATATAMGAMLSSLALAGDLAEIKERGVIRHIGVPYANFVSYIKTDDFESLSGLDVEIVKGFAEFLGVKYEYVPAQWNDVVGKLTGQDALYLNNRIELGDKVSIQGDIIANGATVLDWREELVDFSVDYFPSAVWLVARADSSLTPIEPTGDINKDINIVKDLIDNKDVLAMEHSCLDPNLYNLYETGANIILPEPGRKLNEMVPAILNNDAETTLLDVADTLIALEKWPGDIKVIGPISQDQRMAAAFRKNSPELRHAFNEYLTKIRNDGTYHKLIEKHYPSVFYFYGDYFSKSNEADL
ncbi:ABC transporter substrate-binding protein [Photobacterium gaetbulicola]|uniref:ABC transporter substrate-binding protein n=1 Tax=Photobacterium gaetbulicola TaxID=1295392 RepID=A0A0B9GGD7_9GAMM|nr:transporter substrate-binding domain-containing protein [Photobacterium gaetbulicola]KHT63820.1 ABC transporter substrate-binding protein [Photobacterium gaetbulicola]